MALISVFPPTSMADRDPEVAAESVVHEGIEQRVEAGVHVADQLEHGAGNTEFVRHLTEEQENLHGEERKPANCEEYHDRNQCLDDFLLLSCVSYVVLRIRQRVPDWLSDPEPMCDLAVSTKHGYHGQQVEGQVEEEGVSHHGRLLLEHLHTDEGDAEGWVARLVNLDLDLEFLEEYLRNEEGEAKEPEHQHENNGPSHGAQEAGFDGVTDRVKPEAKQGKAYLKLTLPPDLL